jgi:Hg(II)-responsive transcriptional regulator
MDDDLLTIGRLAKAGGVTPETVRYYERRDLLRRPVRNAAGYRLYSEESVRRLRFIKQAQLLGFTLVEIAELLTLRADPSGTCAEVRSCAERKMADIDERIAALARVRRALATVAAACDGAAAISECPILDTLDRQDASAC